MRIKFVAQFRFKLMGAILTRQGKFYNFND